MKLRYLFIITFCLITVLPMTLFWIWPYSKALDSEIKDVKERHLVIAKNLSATFERYYEDVIGVFSIIDIQSDNQLKSEKFKNVLKNYNFNLVVLVNHNGTIKNCLFEDETTCPQKIDENILNLAKKTVKENEIKISTVIEDRSVNSGPILLVVKKEKEDILLAYLSTKYIVKMGKKVAFGEKGHAAIVDQEGNVLAHPLDSWIKARKNIIKVSAVQKMLEGKTGVEKFYSPALKGDMIAGYTHVPNANWGVMVPQPIIELENKAEQIDETASLVMLLGVALALLISIPISFILIKPLENLSNTIKLIEKGSSKVDFEWKLSKIFPLEIEDLKKAFSNMMVKIEKNEKELKEKSILLHEIINGIPSPIILKDYNGKFILVNQATATLYDSTPEKMIGKDDIDYISDKKTAKNSRDNEKDIMDKGETRIVYENSIDIKTNELKEYMSIKKPLITDKGEKTILVLTSDISELSRKNEELRQKDKILLEQNKLASMGEMISNIAHQWRQPLNALGLLIQNIQVSHELGELDDEFIERSVKKANTLTENMSKTIDDFRNFINNDTKKVKFNIMDSFNSLFKLVEGTITNNGLKVIKNIDESIEIEGHPNELLQCCINIFNNAKDALDNNENEKLIFIDTYIEDEKLKIVFKDNAGGIEEDILLHIFEPYYTTKHKSQGTGLGLSMTHSLVVDGMDGTIIANNANFIYNEKEYSGAEFIISLPIN